MPAKRALSSILLFGKQSEKGGIPNFTCRVIWCMLKNFHREIFLEMGLNDTSAYLGMVIFVILTYGTHNYPFLVGGWNLSSGLIRV